MADSPLLSGLRLATVQARVMSDWPWNPCLKSNPSTSNFKNFRSRNFQLRENVDLTFFRETEFSFEGDLGKD